MEKKRDTAASSGKGGVMDYRMGDEVKWQGCNGTVIDLDPVYGELPLVIRFKQEGTFITHYKEARFTVDGKSEVWHELSALTLVKRVAIKDEVREVYRWVVKDIGDSSVYHISVGWYDNDRVAIPGQSIKYAKGLLVQPILESGRMVEGKWHNG